ncbi:hypothetical protein PUN28_003869 [Cardiocondyla obscurior]|uniref:Uncharacterized protein n=1 Tax=Cardiocondyla obscurior TaxID=286306 RepID=A0AAW2GM16_9HYME
MRRNGSLSYRMRNVFIQPDPYHNLMMMNERPLCEDAERSEIKRRVINRPVALNGLPCARRGKIGTSQLVALHLSDLVSLNASPCMRDAIASTSRKIKRCDYSRMSRDRRRERQRLVGLGCYFGSRVLRKRCAPEILISATSICICHVRSMRVE